MKAIILERRGEYAAVLCEDGAVVRARLSGEVGERVELPTETVMFPARRKSPRWMRGAVAAMLALALLGGTFGYMGASASAYVSLDVEDSSIELTVNRLGRVIAVEALNDDARELADSLSGELRHKKVEDAIDHAMDRLQERGYLKDEGGEVLAGVTAEDTRRGAALCRTVERTVEQGGAYTAYVFETSPAERAQALDRRVSAGRFGYERDRGEGWRPGGRGETAQAFIQQGPPEQQTMPPTQPEDGDFDEDERAANAVTPGQQATPPMRPEDGDFDEDERPANAGTPGQQAMPPTRPEDGDFDEDERPENAVTPEQQATPPTRQF